jgi:DNA-binding transcriptional LysR family regulator
VIVLTFENIVYFIDVCRNKSFSETARELFVSQQAISKCISVLEEELGEALFNRSINGVELTEKGLFLYNNYAKIVEEYKKATNKLPAVFSKIESNDVIACSPILLGTLFPYAKAEFDRIYPNIKLTLIDKRAEDTIQYIHNNPDKLGIAALPSGMKTDKRVKRTMIKSLKLLVCVNKDNPLSNKKTISFRDLKNEKIILYNGSSILYDLIKRKEAACGYKANFIYKTEDLFKIGSMVNSNEGIAIGIRAHNLELYSDIRFIPLRDEGTTVNLVLICQGYDKLSEPLKKFYDFMKSYSENE